MNQIEGVEHRGGLYIKFIHDKNLIYNHAKGLIWIHSMSILFSFGTIFRLREFYF